MPASLPRSWGSTTSTSSPYSRDNISTCWSLLSPPSTQTSTCPSRSTLEEAGVSSRLSCCPQPPVSDRNIQRMTGIPMLTSSGKWTIASATSSTWNWIPSRLITIRMLLIMLIFFIALRMITFRWIRNTKVESSKLKKAGNNCCSVFITNYQ